MAFLIPFGIQAETIDERLSTYLGKPAGTVVADFGGADIEGPSMHVFSFNELRPDMWPSEPAPTDSTLGAKRHGVGMAPRTPAGAYPLPCELRFEFDEHQRVSQVAHHGPGCFEIVFSRTKPAN